MSSNFMKPNRSVFEKYALRQFPVLCCRLVTEVHRSSSTALKQVRTQNVLRITAEFFP